MIDINYEEIDAEIRELVKVLNDIDGFETNCSCCGHGKNPCMIWLKIDSIEALNKFCVEVLNPFYGWHFIIENNIVRNQTFIKACLCSATKDYDEMVYQAFDLVNKIKRIYCF